MSLTLHPQAVTLKTLNLLSSCGLMVGVVQRGRVIFNCVEQTFMDIV
jgi:hypothetical protein